MPVTGSSLLLLLRENVVRETMGERVGSSPVSMVIGNIPKFESPLPRDRWGGRR